MRTVEKYLIFLFISIILVTLSTFLVLTITMDSFFIDAPIGIIYASLALGLPSIIITSSFVIKHISKNDKYSTSAKVAMTVFIFALAHIMSLFISVMIGYLLSGADFSQNAPTIFNIDNGRDALNNRVYMAFFMVASVPIFTLTLYNVLYKKIVKRK